MKEKFLQATADILEKTLSIYSDKFVDKSTILVYDLNSNLSRELSEWYIKNLERNNDAELINFDEVSKEDLKTKLLWLSEDSTVILVQSTNFRIDDFRIRLILKQNWVWCIEHNHLSYIKDDQIENYADSIEYKTPYYLWLANRLKLFLECSTEIQIQTKDNSILNIVWWVEEVKTNTWDYSGKYRWGTFPIWEVFTEAKDFSKVNGSFSVYAYPDENFQVQFVKPFRVDVKDSILSCDDINCPEEFKRLLNKIEASEDWEVFVRELWFWMNAGISKDKKLSDVWAYERVSGFHLSLWKKHNIYRKKFDKSVTQRYHIDIFPDIDTIKIDDDIIFEDWKYKF